MADANRVEPWLAGERAPIGRSVWIKGELEASEDLVIDGRVEGSIAVREHTVTIAANGRVNAQVFAKAVVVIGEVAGNITAVERVEIRAAGSVEGDIAAPRVAISEGAHFRGSIDMQRSGLAARAAGPNEPHAMGTLPASVVPPTRQNAS